MILYMKSQLHHQKNDFKKSEESISRALKFDSSKSIYWDHLSEILYEKKDFQASKNCVEGAITRDPQNPKYYRNLSIILR